MTALAWDGTTLAVDSALSGGAARQSTTKLRLFEADGRPWAACSVGAARAGVALLEWAESGAAVEDFPALAADDENNVSLVVVDLERGRVSEYLGTPYPVVIDSVPAAWGTGEGLALGAMLSGQSASAAVRLACEHCDGCALPVRLVTRTTHAVMHAA